MKSIQLVAAANWRFHTNIYAILTIIPDFVSERKWVLTNWEGNRNPNGFTGDNQKIVVDGNRALEIFSQDFQLIWGVLSGGGESILGSDQSPFAETNDDAWKPFYKIQNKKADFEILAWDSSYTLISAEDDAILHKIRETLGESAAFFTDCLKARVPH